MTEFGQALRLARERRDLSQTQVMALTGINNKTLSGYENGVAEPDLQTSERLYHSGGRGAPAFQLPRAVQRAAAGAASGAGHPVRSPRLPGKKAVGGPLTARLFHASPKDTAQETGPVS